METTSTSHIHTLYVTWQPNLIEQDNQLSASVYTYISYHTTNAMRSRLLSLVRYINMHVH